MSAVEFFALCAMIFVARAAREDIAIYLAWVMTALMFATMIVKALTGGAL